MYADKIQVHHYKVMSNLEAGGNMSARSPSVKIARELAGGNFGHDWAESRLLGLTKCEHYDGLRHW